MQRTATSAVLAKGTTGKGVEPSYRGRERIGGAANWIWEKHHILRSPENAWTGNFRQ